MKYFSVLFLSLMTWQASAANPEFENLSCVVSKAGKMAYVPVVRTMGSAPDQKFEFNGNRIAIGYNPGGSYEPTAVLTIEVNSYSSVVIAPSSATLYSVLGPDTLRVQCYFKQ